MDKLVCFGASTAQGVADWRGGFFKRLKRMLAAAGRPHECLNFGIAGNTTADMAARLDAVKVHLPAKAILLLGSNDVPRQPDHNPGRRATVAAFAANVERIFDAFDPAQTVFVSSFQIRAVTPEVFRVYMQVAVDQAQARGFRVWDLHAESLAFGNRYLWWDGIHYSGAGHKFIAERILSLMPA